VARNSKSAGTKNVSHVPAALTVSKYAAAYNRDSSHKLIQVAGRLVTILRPVRRMELGKLLRRSN